MSEQSPSQKLVFMPLEASGVMSSLGGIAELLSDTIGSDKPNKVAAKK